MNPPFGEMTANTSSYCKEVYRDSKDDIGTAFVSRGGDILSIGGRLGAITNRTYLSIPTAHAWREKYFFGESAYVSELADLGYGVLDDAMVEAAAYVIAKSEKIPAACFNLLEAYDKPSSLNDIYQTQYEKRIFKDVDSFKKFPGGVICHWLPSRFFDRINEFLNIETVLGKIKTGLNTGDDFRFLRLVWETNLKNLGAGDKKWALLSKGGEYSAYTDDFHLTINWGSVDSDMRQVSGARIFNEDDAFSLGVVYPMRTTSDISPRALPANVSFNKASQFLPVSNKAEAKYFIALAYTRSFKVLVEAMYGSGDTSVSGSAARNYTGGVLNALPVPRPSIKIVDEISEIYDLISQKQASLKSMDEMSLLFNSDKFLSGFENNISQSAHKSLEHEFLTMLYVGSKSFDVDKIVANEYQFDEGFLESSWGRHPFDPQYTSSCPISYEELIGLMDADGDDLRPIKGSKRIITKKSFFSSRQIEVAFHLTGQSPSEIVKTLLSDGEYLDNYRHEYSKRLFSVFIGKVMGRWSSPVENNLLLDFTDYNIDKIKGDYLVGDSLPAIESSKLIKKILSKITDFVGVDAESFESEFCQINGISSLEDYIQSPQGFFDWHLSRCSNSRRQAPIYLPIQSASGEVVIWLYYHSLSVETLFWCVNNILEPKLKELRFEVDRFGKSVKDSDKISRKYIELKEKIDEVSDFRDDLIEISKVWMPNYDDGVLINAAPLRELFKHRGWQGKLKKVWLELEKGKHDWSFTAMKYWPERVLKRCYKDRGIALAHSVENDLWEEVEVPSARGRGTKLVWQPKEMSDFELEAYIKNKIAEG